MRGALSRAETHEYALLVQDSSASGILIYLVRDLQIKPVHEDVAELVANGDRRVVDHDSRGCRARECRDCGNNGLLFLLLQPLLC